MKIKTYTKKDIANEFSDIGAYQLTPYAVGFLIILPIDVVDNALVCKSGTVVLFCTQ